MRRNPIAWAALVVASAALLSSTGFLRSMPAAPKVTPESQRTAKALSEAFGAVAAFVKPSVVQISVHKKATKIPGLNLRRFQNPNPGNPRNPGGNALPKDFEDMLRKFFEIPDGKPEKEQFGMPSRGVGSGFVFDNRGHIVTNNHVVEDSEKITVTFYDGTEAAAKVVGTDKQSDVAVIKVENTNYPPLPKGDSSSLKVGELVMAVGSPFELSQSVTSGIISALERNDVSINYYESFIQTDAPINRGNSGGPLVNMDGEVIGINSAIVTGGSSGNDGIGFAIPINMAASVANMLIKDGKVHYARIGIELGALSPVLARQLGLPEDTKGVLVGNVLPDSPAAKAGIEQGDVIVGFAGEKVHDRASFRLKVATSEPSKPYPLVYLREGKERTTSIVPAPAEKIVFDVERESPSADRPGKPAEPAKTTINDFGLEVQPLNAELAKPLGLPADLKGLLVSSVKEGTAAEAAGIQEGDVITKVFRNHKLQAVTSVKEFQDLAARQNEMAVYVQRGKLGSIIPLTKSPK
ncbi:MAG: trypsin-like peptidase domain-containing protein [Isosphaeraceae bacterium]